MHVDEPLADWLLDGQEIGIVPRVLAGPNPTMYPKEGVDTHAIWATTHPDEIDWTELIILQPKPCAASFV